MQASAMTIQRRTSAGPVRPAAGSDAAKTLFAAGGLLAAFGVASCCALPVALSMLGISAASLIGIGYRAAQYQQELFFGAVILLAAAGVVMWRQRRTLACARPRLDWAARVAIALAVGLLALTFWIEPPV
jgi:mercuric ion transport protein